ncbi:hypothetical protein [Streptosporangium sp. NPDC048865]|uniref:hypothetical protein n=1 Tax=Streptosporangium sp. NPDC048865 TaxID=3155766 RepID=UPI00343EBA5C
MVAGSGMSIVAGGLKPGDDLDTAVLQERSGGSRTTIREALRVPVALTGDSAGRHAEVLLAVRARRPEAAEASMRSLIERSIEDVDTGKVDAVSYWDPNGWVVGGDNGVEDTSFFDYGFPHKALDSLNAFNTW